MKIFCEWSPSQCRQEAIHFLVLEVPGSDVKPEYIPRCANHFIADKSSGDWVGLDNKLEGKFGVRYVSQEEYEIAKILADI